MTYGIYNRDGRLVGSVASDDATRAFVMARLALSRAYRDAGIVPATFDVDPPFRIETVGG
jgi:hypothetical protein